MMWGPSRRCGDNRDDVGMTGMTGTTCGDHRPWGPSRGYGDNMRTTGMTGTMWGQCGDDRDEVGMTGTMRGQRGPRGDNKITKNAITFERIEIIKFCLKIWDP